MGQGEGPLLQDFNDSPNVLKLVNSITSSLTRLISSDFSSCDLCTCLSPQTVLFYVGPRSGLPMAFTHWRYFYPSVPKTKLNKTKTNIIPFHMMGFQIFEHNDLEPKRLFLSLFLIFFLTQKPANLPLNPSVSPCSAISLHKLLSSINLLSYG